MTRSLWVIGTVLFLGTRSLATGASLPAWWSGIIQPGAIENNYAVLNNGQLKLVAFKAKAYLDANLSGGSGSAVTSLVASFKPQTGVTYTTAELAQIKQDNYAPATIGQLKAVAKPFYDRLIATGYNTRYNLFSFGYPSTLASNYPWDPATSAATNYSLATIGQLKMVFSFDVTEVSSVDADGDGLIDTWEISWFGNLSHGASEDLNGDGFTNLEEMYLGRSPTGANSGSANLSDFNPAILPSGGADTSILPSGLADFSDRGLDVYKL